MKKLTLFIEDDYIEILQDFKKTINWVDLSDEKAMILMTRYFMKTFNKNNSKTT